MLSHKKMIGLAAGFLVSFLVTAGIVFGIHSMAERSAGSSHKVQKPMETTQDDMVQKLGTGGKGCVIFLHSGGFVVGKNDYHQRFGQALGETLGYDYLVPDYPINESYHETLEYMGTIYEQITSEYDSVIFVGCSAGANLAVATTLAYGDTYGMPQGFILMSPWLDTTMENEKIQCVSDFDKEFYKNLVEWGQQYNQGEVDSELASPIKATQEQLERFPKTVLVVGTEDILRYDAQDFHQELIEAGVSSTYLKAEGKNHGEVFAEYAASYLMPEIMEQALEIVCQQ